MNLECDTIMTYPEREAPKTSRKRSVALRSPTGITPFGYFFNIAKKGAVGLHNFSSCQNAVCSHKFFPLLGRLCSGKLYIFTEQM